MYSLITGLREAKCKCWWHKDGLSVVVHWALRHADVFVFSHGSIVFWGFDEETEAFAMAWLNTFCREMLETPEIEDFRFSYCDQESCVGMLGSGRGGAETILIRRDNSSQKLAVSFALAQSTRLSLCEMSAEETVQRAQGIPGQMAAKGRLRLYPRTISKWMGQLFLQRASVNLYSDMLETPDFFWDHDTEEPLYQQIRRYLEIHKRVEVMNKRIDVMKDLYDQLADDHHDQHATRLELIIIGLITFQILCTGWKLYMYDHPFRVMIQNWVASIAGISFLR